MFVINRLYAKNLSNTTKTNHDTSLEVSNNLCKTSGGLRKSPASCWKPPKDFCGLKQVV